ncbi:hypothetical protein G4V62_17820 [Bacillaceae bacterium SIJ1]|uniref:hypothetical protein n=1 Tax=Litoribacterium kuwaitense TaxID=1398745 RepID=UPI0013EC8B89|nr:hypothetical protein [Litoribacterium kuwaitense]NGP46712.1 hypothetical protein [Litoribacterium kuwaitense]
MSLLAVLGFAFVIGTQSYVQHKEVALAKSHCHDIGGTPHVDTDFLSLKYCFDSEVKED